MNTSHASYDEEEIGDEEIWENVCKVIARRAGISFEQAQTILEENGYSAYGHAGILDALNTVLWATGQKELKRIADTVQRRYYTESGGDRSGCQSGAKFGANVLQVC